MTETASPRSAEEMDRLCRASLGLSLVEWQAGYGVSCERGWTRQQRKLDVWLRSQLRAKA